VGAGDNQGGGGAKRPFHENGSAINHLEKKVVIFRGAGRPISLQQKVGFLGGFGVFLCLVYVGWVW